MQTPGTFARTPRLVERGENSTVRILQCKFSGLRLEPVSDANASSNRWSAFIVRARRFSASVLLYTFPWTLFILQIRAAKSYIVIDIHRQFVKRITYSS